MDVCGVVRKFHGIKSRLFRISQNVFSFKQFCIIMEFFVVKIVTEQKLPKKSVPALYIISYIMSLHCQKIDKRLTSVL